MVPAAICPAIDLQLLQLLFGIKGKPTVGNDPIESRLKDGLRQTRKLAPQCRQKAGVLMAQGDQAIKLTGNLKTLSHSV